MMYTGLHCSVIPSRKDGEGPLKRLRVTQIRICNDVTIAAVRPKVS